MRVNKYEYLYVIQGNSEYGWNDECFEENFAEAKRTIKDYRANCNRPFRIIRRRVSILLTAPMPKQPKHSTKKASLTASRFL